MLTVYKTHLTQKTQLTADVYYLSFELDEPKEFTFIPGQYMIMMVPKEQGEIARRLYSIVTTPTQNNNFSLLIKTIPGGAASAYIQTLNTGDTVQFQGPAGIFSLKQTPRDKIFLVTGCGLAPIRSMLRSHIASVPATFRLFWGVPKVEDVYFLDELKQLSVEHQNFKFHICLSQEKNLDKIPEEDRKYFMIGHINNGFEQTEAQQDIRVNHSEYYLCGNRNVTDSLKEYLGEKHIPKEQVFYEKF